MSELTDFSPNDGHIESVVIGVDQVKVSFQTWNCQELVLVFDDVGEVWSNASMMDVDRLDISEVEKGRFSYSFIDPWDDLLILRLTARTMRIYEVGQAKKENAALFDVGMDYLGRQTYSPDK